MEQENQAAFNMAVASLVRMDKILQQCNISSMHSNFDEWYNALMVLQREVGTIEAESISQVLDVKKRIGVLLRNSRKKNYVVDGNIIRGQLDLYEQLLRKVMEKKGYLIPNTSDPRFAMSRGFL